MSISQNEYRKQIISKLASGFTAHCRCRLLTVILLCMKTSLGVVSISRCNYVVLTFLLSKFYSGNATMGERQADDLALNGKTNHIYGKYKVPSEVILEMENNGIQRWLCKLIFKLYNEMNKQ